MTSLFFGLLVGLGGAGVSVRLRLLPFREGRGRPFFLYLRGLVDLLEGLEERREVSLGRVIGEGDGLGIEVANQILDAFLESDILHDLIATTLTMEVAGEDNCLAVRPLC